MQVYFQKAEKLFPEEVLLEYTYLRRQNLEKSAVKIEEAMEIISERVFESGDVNEALKDIYTEGFTNSPDSRKVGGLRDISFELDELLKSILNDYDPDSISRWINSFGDANSLISENKFKGNTEVEFEEISHLKDLIDRVKRAQASVKEAMRSGVLSDIDAVELGDLLGDQARVNIYEMRELLSILEESGFLNSHRDRFKLSQSAINKIAEKAMSEIFSAISKGDVGLHQTYHEGEFGDLTGQTSKYEFGRATNINLQKSVFNAVLRNGGKAPISLRHDDLEADDYEVLTQSATVLMIDQSRSMGMYGSYVAAKKVALALQHLIRTKFPKDKFSTVGFSDYAMTIDAGHLAESNWNHWVSGTNMQHGLELSRQILRNHKVANKQILMITDGEPTVHMEEGRAYFSHPPTKQTIEETLKEVKRCTREGIIINTFMLEMNYFLIEFIERMHAINGGRTFYAKPDQLGRHMIVDYLKNKTGVG